MDSIIICIFFLYAILFFFEAIRLAGEYYRWKPVPADSKTQFCTAIYGYPQQFPLLADQTAA